MLKVDSEDGESDRSQVLMVRVQLVQSVRLLPNQSVKAEEKLVGERVGEFSGPLMIEPDPVLKAR